MNNKIILAFTFYVRYILSGVSHVDKSPYRQPYLGIHPTMEIPYSDMKTMDTADLSNSYLFKALEYFFHNNLKSSNEVNDFLGGLKKVHDGEEKIFGADDAEDYAQVGIYIEKENKDFVKIIGDYESARKQGFSNNQYVPYNEFVEFLEYWKKFLLEIEKLKLVPVEYIKEEKLEEVKTNQQFKDMEKRLTGDE